MGVEVRNRLVNPVVRSLSRSRAHRLLGRDLAVLGYTGRRTGRRREVPVMAAPAGDEFVVLVGRAAGKTWWRNLDGGPRQVTVRRDGRELSCSARLLRDGQPGRQDAVAAYRVAFPRVTVAPEDPLVVLEPAGTSRGPAGPSRPAGG
ncbi:nitroreductase/quinone reductase family protein [Geodermatophilus sp. FMUSA9-8]|uniref:nitroreductase/quinone reductase family protein n=1 Tax=Geodermatophilus sp. FMUSA9-8 TaxID=3120155 RepID=UPI003008D314